MVALGMVEALSRKVGNVGVFRPVVRAGRPDGLITTVRARFGIDLPYEMCAGVTYDDVHGDADRALGEIVDRYRRLAARCDAVVVIGTDYTDVGAPTEFEFNARLAADLGTPVLNVVTRARPYRDRDRRRGRAHRQGARPAPRPGARRRRHPHHRPGLRRPRHPGVRAAGVDVAARADVADLPPPATAAAVRRGGGAGPGGRTGSSSARFAAHDPRAVHRGAAVIIPSDRAAALLPGLVAAHTAPGFPNLSAIIMTGGRRMPPSVERLLGSMDDPDPGDPHRPGHLRHRDPAVRGRGHGSRPEAQGKVDTALRLFAEHVDAEELLERLAITQAVAVTPLMFEYDLLDRARARRRHIVLPEGEEPRILRAADVLLRRDVVDLTLLGDEERIRAKAAQLGLAAVERAKVISPFDPELRERFAQEYARLRAHKGITVERARDTVTDVSYFGTLMVQTGIADGMVSGAAHTTAHTIRPAFEILRALGLVSSVFFMCLADRVLVYGDCAVVPDPTAEQLAQIAISSAETARRFGIEPRIAMLSYSTGDSGRGADVEKVRTATELVRERRPDLPIAGPIQYDAAIDPSVAKTKLPDSDVAGRATVFIVPDLNTGNILYKGVQRSANAVAVGPVLQGLRKPVNDLSRGATVKDIVTTVAVTAAQVMDDPAEIERAAAAAGGTTG